MENLNFNLINKSVLAAAALSVAGLMSSCSKEGAAPVHMDSSTSVNADQSQEARYIPNQYIVVLKDFSPRSLSKENISAGGPVMKMGNDILAASNIGGAGLSADKLTGSGFIANVSADQAEALRKDPRVASVEQDQIIALAVTGKLKPAGTSVVLSTNNGTQQTPWGVKNIGGAGDGTGKVAWIIDSGIDFNHADLNVDQSSSRSFLASTDGGNYSSPADEYGHGTEVAGIIGAKNNSEGTVGVAANATLISLKVLSYKGSGSLGALVRAVNYAATNGKAGDAVNISIGATASVTLDNAVKALAAKGMFVAIASGNSAADCSNMSPQRVTGTNLFTVAAIDSNKTWASYSDYGSPVKYAAPGTYIYTTQKGGGYAYGSGTSFAAPYMAGILLLTNGNPTSAGYAANDPNPSPKPLAHR